jgi:tripartite-type tricarboxylate transporter receptor subunit TctC
MLQWSPLVENRFGKCLAQGLLALIGFSALLNGQAGAAPYPNHPIEIIVAFGAGGSTDFVARVVAQKLSDRLGQSVVVVNRPGANGAVGINAARRAAPDGYTLFVGYTAELVVLPEISKSADFSADDFEPIAVTGMVPMVLMASKNLKANNLKDLVEELRANPGKYNYGGSTGSPPHLVGAWVAKLKGLDLLHVPYRGGAQVVTDVIGGHVDMVYAGVSAVKPGVDSGQAKGIAITGDKRSPALPDVPTFKEAGMPELDLTSWSMLLAPKGTPKEIIDLLKKETMVVLADPEVKEILAKQGIDAGSGQDPRAFLRAEQEKFKKVVHDLNITMD